MHVMSHVYYHVSHVTYFSDRPIFEAKPKYVLGDEMPNMSGQCGKFLLNVQSGFAELVLGSDDQYHLHYGLCQVVYLIF